nr:MAG TPA: hypothetical protein [Caudoviricetes sp.]
MQSLRNNSVKKQRYRIVYLCFFITYMTVI